MQWAEEKCLLCKIVSSGETAEAGTADTEYTGETELSKYPLSTFRYGVYPINSAYLKALQDLMLHQSELASFCVQNCYPRVIPHHSLLFSCVGSCLFWSKIFLFLDVFWNSFQNSILRSVTGEIICFETLYSWKYLFFPDIWSAFWPVKLLSVAHPSEYITHLPLELGSLPQLGRGVVTYVEQGSGNSPVS